ncbi:carbohydrate ABC transporter permease, partial [Rothia nasimurium]|uniref:carbohydrate ABC transporter permease n=1 Tax=Rothia nasimurium TaxID=85336 RepID=UPI00361A10AF
MSSIATIGANKKPKKVNRLYYYFLVPSLILFTLSITLPALMGIFYSFTDSIGFGDYNFVGLNNYAVLFSDPAVVRSYLFTIGVSLLTVILTNIIALLLAVGLTSQIKFRTTLRTMRLIQKSHPQPKTPTPAPPQTPAHTTP